MANLKAEQYWKWRQVIETMNHSSTKFRYAQLMASFMEKEIENQKLKLDLYKVNRLKAFEENIKLAKDDYEALKKEIESEIGQSLNNCSIDDITFEVKQLDENVNS